PKGLPSGLKMKRFLKDTGVVRPTNKAFAFRQLDDALEWVEAQALEGTAAARAAAAALALRDMPAFAGCSEEALAALETSVEFRVIKSGKKLWKADAAGDELFLIRRGAVKILLPLGKKESYHLATSGPGDIVGAMGFLDASVHVADALALTEVEVYVLSRTLFNTLAERQPSVALAITEHLARNLSDRLRVAVSEVQALRG
ncbi:MAG: cyclic nucleotide-binding domain-containing protein, partial [Pseudomonadota bacterium]